MKETQSADRLREIAALRQRQAELEHELSESRALYGEHIDSVTHLFFARDKDLKLISANKAYQAYIGKNEEDIIGKSVFEIFGEGPAQKKAEMLYRKVLESGEPLSYREEYEYNGELRIYEVNMFPSRIGISVFTQDITERAHIEETLRESEARFRAVLDSSWDVIYRFNIQTSRFDYISPSCTQIVGFSAEELMALDSETALAMLHPEDRSVMEAAMARLQEEGEAEAEYRQRGKDGCYRWFSNHLSLTRDSVGRPLYRSGSIRDVTERKRTEEALGNSERRLRKFYESGLLGVIYWNTEGKITDANDKFLEMVGYTRDELAAGHIDWINITPPEYRYLDEKALAEMKATGVSSPFEKVYLRKDGARLPIIIAGAMVDKERSNGVAFVLDITKRRHAEELVRQQQLELESLYRNAHVGLCMLDRDLRYVRVNERLAEINGIAAADHIGKTVREIVPDIADIAEPALREIIESGVPKIDIEINGETAAQPGVKRSWMESWLPIFDKDGAVAGLNIVVVETTALKRVEEELRDTNRGLEVTKKKLEDEIEERAVLHDLIIQKNEELEGFAFKVSHELKNNLIGIKRMMQMCESDPDFLRDSTPHLVENSERLMAFVERTLELARSGRKIGETQMISLDPLVRSLFVQVKPEGVEGELIIREELPDIRGDSRGMEEVFSNLISNSFGHRSPEKEKVVIEVEYKEHKAHTSILFRDNGSGISHDDLVKIFDPAFTTKEKGGFGFGLAIAKKVIEAHGGSIKAQSKGHGQGAEFIITLPRAQTC
jgi:PAS domain S-box-containing protein